MQFSETIIVSNSESHNQPLTPGKHVTPRKEEDVGITVNRNLIPEETITYKIHQNPLNITDRKHKKEMNVHRQLYKKENLSQVY